MKPGNLVQYRRFNQHTSKIEDYLGVVIKASQISDITKFSITEDMHNISNMMYAWYNVVLLTTSGNFHHTTLNNVTDVVAR
jgi:hypothetical protein